MQATKECFDDILGVNRYARLLALAVNPEYEEHDIESMLVQSCMDVARKARVPIVLFATQVEKPFYLSLGFSSVGTKRVQVAGEKLSAAESEVWRRINKE